MSSPAVIPFYRSEKPDTRRICCIVRLPCPPRQSDPASTGSPGFVDLPAHIAPVINETSLDDVMIFWKKCRKSHGNSVRLQRDKCPLEDSLR